MVGVIVRAEVAVAEASDLEPGVLGAAPLHQRRDHLGLGAEEIDAQPVLSGCRQKARHEVHAGHSLRCRLTRGPQGPDHRHAVGHGEMARPAGRSELRIMPHHAQMGRVDGHDHVGGARRAAQLEAAGDRGIHGDGIEGEAQQLRLLGRLSRPVAGARQADGLRACGGVLPVRPGRGETPLSYSLEHPLLEQAVHHIVRLAFGARPGRLLVLCGVAEELGVQLDGDRLTLLAQRGHAVGRPDLHVSRDEDLAAVDRPHDLVQRDRQPSGLQQRPLGRVPALHLGQNAVVDVEDRGHGVDDALGQKMIECRDHVVGSELPENAGAGIVVHAAHLPCRDAQLLQHGHRARARRAARRQRHVLDIVFLPLAQVGADVVDRMRLAEHGQHLVAAVQRADQLLLPRSVVSQRIVEEECDPRHSALLAWRAVRR